jgi:hypothetical protein
VHRSLSIQACLLGLLVCITTRLIYCKLIIQNQMACERKRQWPTLLHVSYGQALLSVDIRLLMVGRTKRHWRKSRFSSFLPVDWYWCWTQWGLAIIIMINRSAMAIFIARCRESYRNPRSAYVLDKSVNNHTASFSHLWKQNIYCRADRDCHWYESWTRRSQLTPSLSTAAGWCAVCGSCSLEHWNAVPSTSMNLNVPAHCVLCDVRAASHPINDYQQYWSAADVSHSTSVHISFLGHL